MENKTITIKLTENAEVILNTDNPDIKNLVEMIVKYRDKINKNHITVESNIDDFDSEGFTELVKGLIEAHLEALKIENEAFEKAMTSISK